MNQYDVKAYAKINLGLDVLDRLPNGYHEIKTVMQTVGICDELSLEKADSGIVLTADCAGLSVGEDNLICRAARLMQETYSVKEGVRIRLKKRIPIAAGMAGGSADAAAVMKGMNVLFRLGVPDRELAEISSVIGADVPYCILGGTALAEGIGEKLTALPPAPVCHVVVAKPDVSVSTKYVYEQLDTCETLRHPDIDGMVNAVRAGNLSGILSRMGNVLEAVTIPAHPVIASLKARLRKLGAAGSLMSGSGPAVFGIFTQEETARLAFERLKQDPEAKQVFLTALL
ncbi:MAG: 4-(cytidine 5'-diphospho)-2-C-methyl-D-erythritol kinase [bacterium]|nr:4-(cytidine 5'-diphospho)-2-C-methyl-D-erythritol kinase [bacterium]